MVDPTSSNRPIGDATPALEGDVAHARRCPACGTDLGRLPMAAKYCPRCGTDLQQSAAVPLAPQGLGTAHDHADALIQTNASNGNLPSGLNPASRTPILRGFANALYRLGRRYEGGLGSRYNPSEAERCYFKAAKLGNSAAIARLKVGDAEENRADPISDSYRAQ